MFTDKRWRQPTDEEILFNSDEEGQYKSGGSDSDISD